MNTDKLFESLNLRSSLESNCKSSKQFLPSHKSKSRWLVIKSSLSHTHTQTPGCRPLGFKLQTTERYMAPKVIHSSLSGFHSKFARSDPGSQQLLTSRWHWNPPILNQFCAHSTPISPCCLLSRSTFLLFFSILPPSAWSPFCLLLTDPPSLLPLSLRHDLPKQMQGRSLTALSLMLSTDSGIVPRDVWHLGRPWIRNREERLYGCNGVKENATTRLIWWMLCWKEVIIWNSRW